MPSSHGTAFARFLAPVLPLDEAEHGGVHRARAAAALRGGRVAGWRWPAWLVYGRAPGAAPSRIGVPRNAAAPARCSRSTTWTRSTTRSSCGPIYRLSPLAAPACSILSVIDGLVNGVATASSSRGRCGLRRIQTGFVMNYALGMLLGAVAVVAYLLAAPREPRMASTCSRSSPSCRWWAPPLVFAAAAPPRRAWSS